MRPLDFYDFGLALAVNATQEVDQRTVVNRLYYGLHHEACCRFFRKNPSEPALRRSNRHTGLRQRFNDPTDPPSSRVAMLLMDLQSLRTECDYQLSQALPNGTMTRAVQLARQLVGALDLYSPGEGSNGCDCPAVR